MRVKNLTQMGKKKVNDNTAKKGKTEAFDRTKNVVSFTELT